MRSNRSQYETCSFYKVLNCSPSPPSRSNFQNRDLIGKVDSIFDRDHVCPYGHIFDPPQKGTARVVKSRLG